MPQFPLENQFLLRFLQLIHRITRIAIKFLYLSQPHFLLQYVFVMFFESAFHSADHHRLLIETDLESYFVLLFVWDAPDSHLQLLNQSRCDTLIA